MIRSLKIVAASMVYIKTNQVFHLVIKLVLLSIYAPLLGYSMCCQNVKIYVGNAAVEKSSPASSPKLQSYSMCSRLT